jgi:hypothetical protein
MLSSPPIMQRERKQVPKTLKLEMLTTPFLVGILMQLQQMLGAGAIGLAYELPDIIVPAKQREQALLSVLDGETRNPEPAAECHLHLKVFKLFFCSFHIICEEING